MIITALRAENFLKYQQLELADIPRDGIIAISGPNESGKSTIGETLCFVLFGRSFSLAGEGLVKLIRWGAAHCSVTCDFEVEGSGYRLVRYLDTDGVHNAQLMLEGQDEPFANGIEPVADALFDLLGFEYEEFIDSFYLAQREITKPHPHSYAVKSMAGIAVVEYVLDELKQERRAQQLLLDEDNVHLDGILDELDELAFDRAHLPQLEAALVDVTAREAQGEGHLNELKKHGLAYQESIPLIKKLSRARVSTVSLQLLVLALALAATAMWALLGQAAEGVSGLRLLRLLFADWQGFVPAFGNMALALAVLFVLLLLRYWVAGVRIGMLRRRSQRLAAALDGISTYARSKALNELLEQEPEEDEEADDYPRVEFDEAACTAMRGKVGDGTATVEQIMEGIADFADWLRYVINVQRREMNLLKLEIGDESGRQAQFDALHGKMTPLQAQIVRLKNQVGLRDEAMRLLKSAGHHMSQRFNADLRDLAGHTLPLFTEERYEHLQIDEELNVRVFSCEKRDYMELEEISSGTQRQIMLAVRLALAQQVADNAVMDSQFAFLDEPFAFFDAERTRNSLKVLGNLSEDITQIWVVAQEFPEELSYDRRIYCKRDADILIDTRPSGCAD
jgi:exonuclease SbcC